MGSPIGDSNAVRSVCCGCVTSVFLYDLRATARDEVLPAASMSSAGAPNSPSARTIRLTGVLDAVRSTRVVVPQLTGPARQMTLTRIIPNGSEVVAGDIVAEFAGVEQIDLARESAARFEDLSFQVRQREADNIANLERRRSAVQQAEADLAKALLEVSKAEILSAIEAEQNVIRAEKARLKVESLARSDAENERVDAAALRILELQRDRQRSAFERAEANLERLRLRAAIGRDGGACDALQQWRNDSSAGRRSDETQQLPAQHLRSDGDAGSCHCRRAGRRPVAAGARSGGLR